jgi:hypothetical protein
MTDRFTPAMQDNDKALFVVVAQMRQDYVDVPTVLYAGTSESTAKTIRNRASKGRGPYTGLSNVRVATVPLNKTFEDASVYADAFTA